MLLIADEDGVEVPHSILRYHVSGQILPEPMLYITDTPAAAHRFSRQHLVPAPCAA